MTWQYEADKAVNTPVVLVSIEFQSGERRYSVNGVRANGFMWKGNIVSLPQILNSGGDIDRTYERGNISIIFSDTDYEFRGLEDSETISFRKRRVIIKIGFQEDNYTSLLTIYTGRIYSWKRLPNLQFQINVTDMSRNLEIQYPNTFVGTDEFPHAHGSALGQPIPIPYGHISNGIMEGSNEVFQEGLGGAWPTLYINTNPDQDETYEYLVGVQQDEITVHQVYKDGAQTFDGTVDYTHIAPDGKQYTVIFFAASQGDAVITCNITFTPTDPDEGVGPVANIYHFLCNFGGYSIFDFNSASLVAAIAVEDAMDLHFEGGLTSPVTLKTWLDIWRSEFELDIYWNMAGEICFLYAGSIAEESLRTYFDYSHGLSHLDSTPQVDRLYNYVFLRYKYDYYGQTFALGHCEQSYSSQETYDGVFRLRKEMYFIRLVSGAEAIAKMKLARYRDPVTLATLTFPLCAFSLELLDCLNLYHFEGEGPVGYEYRLMQIRSKNINLDNLTVEVILEDVTKYGEGFSGPS